MKRRVFQTHEGMRRIELYGMPFQPYFQDHFTFVNAILDMLKDLLKGGYTIISVANIGHGRDMFVWFLRKDNYNTRKPHQFGLLELLGRCKLRTYGNLHESTEDLEAILKDSGYEIVEKESKFLFTSLRVNSNIWDTKRSVDTLKSKAILCKIMHKLEEDNMRVYMSIPLDRKRSTIMHWKDKDASPPMKRGFFLSMMRKNRFVLSEADEKTKNVVKAALKSSWKRKVMTEDPLLSECEGSQTFILEGNPFTDGSPQKVRDILDVMFALFKQLQFEGWTACVNVHMITNVIERAAIWFTHTGLKETDFCSISVENQDSLRAYKVPENCIDTMNITILDCVLPEKHGWVIEKEEYIWKFEEKIWVPSSSKDWNEEETLIEKGHALLCTMLHSMLQEDYHPVIALNMPPSGVAEQEEGASSSRSRNLCTFFFAKDVQHLNSTIYPLKSSDITGDTTYLSRTKPAT